MRRGAVRSMSDSMYRLSFTIGPVQGFVGQARRTKDFWAGSWLLSYLSEVAILAAEEGAQSIVIPYRGDHDKGIITSLRSVIGGIPNRFEMRFDNAATAKCAAGNAITQFNSEWLAIAELVRASYVDPIANNGNQTEEIWKRQVESFWELSWVVTSENTPNQLAGRALQARKHFRNVQADPEPGAKCTLMSDYQELSGHFGAGEWAKQREFWTKFRDSLEKHEGLDLGSSERLCSIAIIKRFLPNVIASLPVHVSLRGLEPDNVAADIEEQSRWPSLGFFAALPWLKRMETAEAIEYNRLAQDFGNSGAESCGGFWPSETAPAKLFNIEWATVDATAWFKTGLINNEPNMSKVKQQLLLDKLTSIYEQQNEPIPYYALLLMDGDSMGKLLEQLGDSSKLSLQLAEFSKKVNPIVHKYDGRPVYAGGDDVLAFLPAEKALAAATELAGAYRESFGNVAQATLSAAIIYAHWRFPLSRVIRLAHHLLDDVAKEATGRDSLALAIVQGSGLNAIWAAPWSVILGKCDEYEHLVPLTDMVDRFAADDRELGAEGGSVRFNASYLYLLRQQFVTLFSRPNVTPGSYQRLPMMDGSVAQNEILVELAHSEYRRRMTATERAEKSRSLTKPEVEQLMTFSQEWLRDETSGQIHCNASKFTFDGWSISRFMKQVREGVLPDHE